MTNTLYQQMAEVIAYRDYQGWTTDTRAMRTWLEHALKPGYTDNPLNRENSVPFDREWLTVMPTPAPTSGHDWSAWLSPNGQWYHFMYAGHYDFSHKAFGHDTGWLESANWLHISGGRVYNYYTQTARQRRALEAYRDAGYRLRDIDNSFYRDEDNMPAQPTNHDYDPRLLSFSRAPLTTYQWDDPKYWKDPALGHPAVLAMVDKPALTGPVWDRDANALEWQPAAKVA